MSAPGRPRAPGSCSTAPCSSLARSACRAGRGSRCVHPRARWAGARPPVRPGRRFPRSALGRPCRHGLGVGPDLDVVVHGHRRRPHEIAMPAGAEVDGASSTSLSAIAGSMTGNEQDGDAGCRRHVVTRALSARRRGVRIRRRGGPARCRVCRLRAFERRSHTRMRRHGGVDPCRALLGGGEVLPGCHGEQSRRAPNPPSGNPANLGPMERGHRPSELRSIELHRRVAQKLIEDPAVLGRARRRAEDWLRWGGPVHPAHARAWIELLSRSPSTIAAELVADTERMRTLRQATPFAGVLSEGERQSVLRSLVA
jgi:hypothetical protein